MSSWNKDFSTFILDIDKKKSNPMPKAPTKMDPWERTIYGALPLQPRMLWHKEAILVWDQHLPFLNIKW